MRMYSGRWEGGAPGYERVGLRWCVGCGHVGGKGGRGESCESYPTMVD